MNFEEVTKLNDKEFEKELTNWMLDKNVTRELHATLRKNLFEKFNSTKLGRKLRKHQNQGGIISPLSLVLNTLIAEFLFAQNCHFSLSVFCSEIPYQNTIPNFEQKEHFRFSNNDINEILDIFDGEILKSKEIRNTIISEYNNSKQLSCLYVIFDAIFKSKKVRYIDNLKNTAQENIHLNTKQHSNDVKQSHSNQSFSRKGKLSKYLCSVYKRNLLFMKKCVILLAKRIKSINKSMYYFEKQTSKPPESNVKIVNKFNDINENIKEIIKLFNSFSYSKYNKNIETSVICAINQLTKQFEACFLRLEENITKNSKPKLSFAAQTTEQPNSRLHVTKNQIKINPAASVQTQTNEYQDPLSIKQKLDKHLLLKIEKSIHTTLDRECERMLQYFTEKMQNEKKILKLKYKQKYLEHLTVLQLHRTNDSINKTQNETILTDTKASDNKFKQETKIYTNNKPLAKDTCEKETEVEQVLKSTVGTNTVQSLKEDTESPRSQPRKEKFNTIVENLQSHLSNADSLVYEAKLRVNQLEEEGNRIDSLFRDYLMKRQSNYRETKQIAEAIWEKYNLEKTILDKKCEILHKQPILNFQNELTELNRNLHSEIVPDISGYDFPPKGHTSNLKQTKKHSVKHFEFENPFRRLQHEGPLTRLKYLNENLELSPKDISNHLQLSVENACKTNIRELKEQSKKKSTYYRTFVQYSTDSSTQNEENEIEKITKYNTKTISKPASEISSIPLLKTQIDGSNSVETITGETEKSKIDTNDGNNLKNLISDSKKQKNMIENLKKTEDTTKIFQIDSFSKDDEVNKILENPQPTSSGKSFNSRKSSSLESLLISNEGLSKSLNLSYNIYEESEST